MRDVAKFAVGTLLAALLLGWAFRGKDARGIGQALQRASVPGLLLAATLNLAQNVPRVWRWGALLRPARPDVGFRPMLGAVMIGYMTTFLIPGRVGELVRPALLSGREKVPLGPCLGSVLADRLLDAVTILALFGLAVAWEPVKAENLPGIRSVALGLVALVVGGAAGLAMLARHRARLGRWLASWPRPVGWVARSALSVARGLEALREPRLAAAVACHSLVCWLLIALGTWVGLQACGVVLSFPSVLVLMPLLALGIAIPTPGNVGGYHVVMAVALERMFGVAGETAVGAGVLMQYVVIMLPFFLIGPVMMARDGIRWRHLLELARQVRSLGSAEAPPGSAAGGEAP
jgi:hypothetical protein